MSGSRVWWRCRMICSWRYRCRGLGPMGRGSWLEMGYDIRSEMWTWVSTTLLCVISRLYTLRGLRRTGNTCGGWEIHVGERFHKLLLKPSRHGKTQVRRWVSIHRRAHASTVGAVQRLIWGNDRELIQTTRDLINLGGSYQIPSQTFHWIFRPLLHTTCACLKIVLSNDSWVAVVEDVRGGRKQNTGFSTIA